MKIRTTMMALACLGLLTLTCSPASATTQAYCELYAKDFADGRTSSVDHWQLLYRGAFDDCMLQYAATPDTAAPIAAQEPVAAEPEPEPVKAKPKPKVTKVAARKTTATAAAKTARKGLIAGSEEWNDFCDRKYRSFNRQNGTYLSRNGKIRRCQAN
jgi:BA14K-like protein